MLNLLYFTYITLFFITKCKISLRFSLRSKLCLIFCLNWKNFIGSNLDFFLSIHFFLLNKASYLSGYFEDLIFPEIKFSQPWNLMWTQMEQFPNDFSRGQVFNYWSLKTSVIFWPQKVPLTVCIYIYTLIFPTENTVFSQQVTNFWGFLLQWNLISCMYDKTKFHFFFTISRKLWTELTTKTGIYRCLCIVIICAILQVASMLCSW